MHYVILGLSTLYIYIYIYLTGTTIFISCRMKYMLTMALGISENSIRQYLI